MSQVARCLARIAEENADLNNEQVIRCPVCGKSFGEVMSESQMTRHVEACLCGGRQKNEDGETGEHAETPSDGEDSDGESSSSFMTVIVGRRYATKGADTLVRGLDVRISLELNNPYDSNALLCTTSSGAAIGHLPAPIAAKLGPLLRARTVHVSGVTLRDSFKLENVPIRVTTHFHVDEGAPIDLDAQDALVESLRAIAREHRENLSLTARRFLDRLKHIFETVEAIERRALGDDEIALFRAFDGLTPSAQILWTRLALRTRTYYASNKLHANDVHDVHKTVRELIAAGMCRPVDIEYLTSSPTVSLATAVVNDVFSNKAELIDMLAAMGRPAKVNAKRDELVAGICKCVRSQRQLKWSFVLGTMAPTDGSTAPAKLISDACGTVFKIDSRQLLAFFRAVRLFFLNEGQSLGSFYAVDAGTLRYPSFPITREREIFRNREAYLEYENALLDAQTLIDAIERSYGGNKVTTKGPLSHDENGEAAVASALAPVWRFLDAGRNKTPPDETIPPFLQQYDARWLYSVMATVGIGLLERQKDYRTAIERIQQLLGGHYCPERRGYWWTRLSVDFEHVGRPTDSLELAETALADPTIAAHERLTLRKRVLKLCKPPRRWLKPAWKEDIPPEPHNVTIEADALHNPSGAGRVRYQVESHDDVSTPSNARSTISVEELALRHYASDQGGNFEGMHCEGSVFTTVFTLVLWPALFGVPVRDAFRTALQTAPLDLESPGFFACRSQEINKILDDLRAGHGPRLLEQTWHTHHGTAVIGIGNWDSWDLDQLKTIIECFGGPAIASIIKILCEDYRNMTAGMPDLVLWNAERRVAKLSEVKSQRDVLSDKQRCWIHELEKAGVEVEVLNVKEVGGRKKRGRAR